MGPDARRIERLCRHRPALRSRLDPVARVGPVGGRPGVAPAVRVRAAERPVAGPQEKAAAHREAVPTAAVLRRPVSDAVPAALLPVPIGPLGRGATTAPRGSVAPRDRRDALVDAGLPMNSGPRHVRKALVRAVPARARVGRVLAGRVLAGPVLAGRVLGASREKHVARHEVTTQRPQSVRLVDRRTNAPPIDLRARVRVGPVLGDRAPAGLALEDLALEDLALEDPALEDPALEDRVRTAPVRVARVRVARVPAAPDPVSCVARVARAVRRRPVVGAGNEWRRAGSSVRAALPSNGPMRCVRAAVSGPSGPSALLRRRG